jgi:nitric oxide reductase large subunit
MLIASMSRKQRFVSWHFIFFTALAFYTLGAGYLEAFVNYPLWHIIGKSDQWINYHVALGPRIILALAFPTLVLSLISNILLLFFKPPEIPRWLVWCTLLLLLVGILSTAFIQIPIQVRLDQGYNEALVNRLISTSFWLRELMAAARSILVACMFYCIIKNRNVV